MSHEYTHFGYQSVTPAEKTKKVADVFASVAERYDLMNDLMSFGIHRLWKQFAMAASYVRPGQRVLDLAGGTGDLSLKLAKLVGKHGEVVLADINPSMLSIGRDRLINAGMLQQVRYVLANAEALPFTPHYFHCATIAFGLRNVTHKEQALRSLYTVLRPAGRLLVLEFSKPIVSQLQAVYDAYSFHVLPWLGEKIVNDSSSYQYLAESIRMHPSQEQLTEMILAAGFDQCEHYNLAGGIVALHSAVKY